MLENCGRFSEKKNKIAIKLVCQQGVLFLWGILWPEKGAITLYIDNILGIFEPSLLPCRQFNQLDLFHLHWHLKNPFVIILCLRKLWVSPNVWLHRGDLYSKTKLTLRCTFPEFELKSVIFLTYCKKKKNSVNELNVHSTLTLL